MSTTGLTSPKCYAAQYRDCDGRRASREHYVSRALLEALQADGTGLRVEGLAGSDGPLDVTAQNLVARVLCERHNSMLSEVDTAIVALHDAWLSAACGRPVDVTISGNLLERWSLKLLMGICASGAARIDGKQRVADAPPAVLDVIFGGRHLPGPRGFYFMLHDDKNDGLKIKILRGPDGSPVEDEVLGIVVQFLAFRFLTLLRPTPPQPAHRFFFRPAGIDFGDGSRIAFDWIDAPGSPTLPIDLRMKTGSTEKVTDLFSPISGIVTGQN